MNNQSSINNRKKVILVIVILAIKLTIKKFLAAIVTILFHVYINEGKIELLIKL